MVSSLTCLYNCFGTHSLYKQTFPLKIILCDNFYCMKKVTNRLKFENQFTSLQTPENILGSLETSNRGKQMIQVGLGTWRAKEEGKWVMSDEASYLTWHLCLPVWKLPTVWRLAWPPDLPSSPIVQELLFEILNEIEAENRNRSELYPLKF